MVLLAEQHDHQLSTAIKWYAGRTVYSVGVPDASAVIPVKQFLDYHRSGGHPSLRDGMEHTPTILKRLPDNGLPAKLEDISDQDKLLTPAQRFDKLVLACIRAAAPGDANCGHLNEDDANNAKALEASCAGHEVANLFVGGLMESAFGEDTKRTLPVSKPDRAFFHLEADHFAALPLLDATHVVPEDAGRIAAPTRPEGVAPSRRAAPLRNRASTSPPTPAPTPPPAPDSEDEENREVNAQPPPGEPSETSEAGEIVREEFEVRSVRSCVLGVHEMRRLCTLSRCVCKSSDNDRIERSQVNQAGALDGDAVPEIEAENTECDYAMDFEAVDDNGADYAGGAACEADAKIAEGGDVSEREVPPLPPMPPPSPPSPTPSAIETAVTLTGKSMSSPPPVPSPSPAPERQLLRRERGSSHSQVPAGTRPPAEYRYALGDALDAALEYVADDDADYVVERLLAYRERGADGKRPPRYLVKYQSCAPTQCLHDPCTRGHAWFGRTVQRLPYPNSEHVYVCSRAI